MMFYSLFLVMLLVICGAMTYAAFVAFPPAGIVVGIICLAVINCFTGGTME